jgi:hypothetical protein
MLNYSLAIFFLAICTSCSNKEYSYFPLNSGLKWHYNVLLTTRDGLKKQKYILHNIGSDTLNGEPVFLRKSLDGTILYYSVLEKGIYYLGSLDSSVLDPKFISDKRLVIPKPFAINTKWEQLTTTKLLKKLAHHKKQYLKLLQRYH